MSRCYSQFTLADRRRLHHLVERKVPINEMARQLGRHRSTIYREIRRNTFRDHELPEYSGYFSTVADDIAKQAGTPVAWAEATHLAAQQVTQPVHMNDVLGKDYLKMAKPVMDEQLALAGLRLAAIINEALK